MHFSENKLIYTSILSLSFALVYLNLIYCYQGNRGILLRSGMNFKKWKYVFLKTDASYQDCLGGGNDLTPYANKHPQAILADSVKLDKPFNYEKSDYGLSLCFDSIGFFSNRIHIKIKCIRKEMFTNSSKDVLICVSVDDKDLNKTQAYVQLKLNEIPSKDCCKAEEINYSANMNSNFKTNDRLTVFIWNRKKLAFLVEKFSVKVYNYNYQIN